MKKDATATVLSKFAQAIDLCPDPELSKKLSTAMSKYTEGGHDDAEREVEAVLAEALAAGIPGWDS